MEDVIDDYADPKQARIAAAGGPAFPVSIPGVGDNGWQGMTLRDWFAGKALPSVIAAILDGKHNLESGDDPATAIAADAYSIADAMLAERSK
jgi:hypothetical protein